MKKKREVSTVKISRPKVSGVAPRPRLFNLLDAGRNKPVMWISGPAGSGKTTLVASWLDARKLPCLWYQVDESDSDIASFFYYMGLAAKKTAPGHKRPLPLLAPEYLQGISTFTRRYFEELYRRITPPRPPLTKKGMGGFVMVFDNFQDAGAASFHAVMSYALDTIPEGITVITLSRYKPPAQLSRLSASNKIAFVGWNEVRFTRKESGELLKAQGHGRPDEGTVALLHEKTEGWAAGLVLMMAGAGPSASALRAFGDGTQAGIFDYFASEIFDKTDGATQDFLLTTSFLPRIEPADAEQLTGNPMAAQLLEQLSRSHYFTQKYDRAYQYHPLFREFLQNRARAALSPDDIVFIRRSAAVLLEKSGRTEEAIGLSIDACDWSGAERLLLARAATLVSQGRSKIIEEWILRIPREIAADAPWLTYWLGVCRIHYSPAEAKKHFENAYRRFREKRDLNGLFLAWAGIVEALVYGLGDFKPLDIWIAWLHETYSQGMPLLPPEIDARVAADMFMAMVYRQPHHRDIRFWLERSLTLAPESGNMNLSLQAYSTAANYYFWIGDLDGITRIGSKIGEFDRSPEVSPFHKIVWRFIDAANDLCFAPSAASAIPKLNEAISIADETGVHIWDHMLFALGVYSSNLQGDFVEADAFLKRMKPLLSNARLHLNCQYHVMNAWLAVLRCDCHHALVNAEAALKLARETGFLFPEIICLLELANILQTDGRHKEAGSYLEEALGLALKTKSPLFQFAGLLSKARVDLEKGRERDGLRILSDAMQIGKKKGYLGPPWWWQPSVMAALCARALEHGIETDYVRKLIRLRSLVPAENMTGLDNWPYPVRIYTLGKFEILIEDEPVHFSGKVQQKPLAMLKALIALGGKDVSENRLSDILWPEAEGDSAHKSFEMTLLRLRRLLGKEDAVTFRGNAVSLDQRLCWVDVQGFGLLAGKAEEARERRPARRSKEISAEAVRLSEKALEMYNGPFLPNDAELDCTTGMREKMRNTALQLVASLGNHAETAGQWKRAIDCYRRGIEIDKLFEEFYRRLMICCENLGQRTEAVRVYEQCRAALSAALGMEPTADTQGVYNRLRRA